jgi:pimeloyl-ACP methyl ester carboxylesterase
MPKVRVNNVALYYEAEGTGPPVVLIHGHTLNLRMWDAQVPVLARDHRVIRYDVRGHGRSDSPPTGYGYPIYAEDLAALLNYIGVDAAALIGFSAGAAIALEFALRYPDRASGLVLAGSVVEGYRFSDSWNQFWVPFREVMRTVGPRTAIEGLWLDHPMFSTLRRSPAKFHQFRDMVLTYEGGEYLAREPTRLQRSWRQVERLGEIRVPALVVVGEQDVPDLQGVADHLAGALPAAQKKVIAGSGHMITLERPGPFNAAIREFLTRLENPAGETQADHG